MIRLMGVNPNQTHWGGGGGGGDTQFFFIGPPPASKVAMSLEKVDEQGGGGGGGGPTPFFAFKMFGSIFQTQSRGTHCSSPTSLSKKKEGKTVLVSVNNHTSPKS